jgi:hydroxymethylpyrimidine pyrophosphatase-like HAD family hydrolase
LAQRLQVPKDAVAAFGNDDNDLSLKAYAGRFVAAKNSSPAALAAADQVADSIPATALQLCLGTDKKEGKPW